MYKFPPLWAVCAIGALSMAKGIHEEPIRVREVLDRPGFPRVQVAGTCDINADGATCWDLQGRPFKSMGDRITAYYSSQSGKDVTLQPGVKHRWIAVERDMLPPRGGFSYVGLGDWNSGEQIQDWRTGMSLAWMKVDLRKQDTTASITARFSRDLPGIQVALKEGASAEIGGFRLTVKEFGNTEPKPEDIDVLRWRAPKIRYGVRLELFLPSTEKLGNVRATLYDTSDRAISHVAEDGKPMPPRMNRITWSQNNEVRSWVDTSVAGEIECRTNVDPQYIGSIRFLRSDIQKVVFEPIPIY